MPRYEQRCQRHATSCPPAGDVSLWRQCEATQVFATSWLRNWAAGDMRAGAWGKLGARIWGFGVCEERWSCCTSRFATEEQETP